MSGVLTNSFSSLLRLRSLSVGVESPHTAAVGLELGSHKQQGAIPTLGLRKNMKFPFTITGQHSTQVLLGCCRAEVAITLAPSANKTDPVMQPLC